jgi:hypothetical protein
VGPAVGGERGPPAGDGFSVTPMSSSPRESMVLIDVVAKATPRVKGQFDETNVVLNGRDSLDAIGVPKFLPGRSKAYR